MMSSSSHQDHRNKRDLFGRVVVGSTDQTDFTACLDVVMIPSGDGSARVSSRSALNDIASIAGEKPGLQECFGTRLLLSVNGHWYSMPDCFDVPQLPLYHHGTSNVNHLRWQKAFLERP